MALPTFQKLPLGGVDRRSLVKLLKEKGAEAAQKLFDAQLGAIESTHANIADDMAVLILGGSNGITRALAMQLLFGEKTAVIGVHYDSAKMQIGSHHVAAMTRAAEEQGTRCRFFNRDATREKTIEEVIGTLKEDGFRAVHFVNGIAAGATKRYEKHGPTQVLDLDIAFDPVLQVPDFANREAYRQLGMVDVGVATEAEIERTNKFMGFSTELWIDKLAEAGLIASGESIVSFCDYDFEKDDPVYAMGPLAGAKILQREKMEALRDRHNIAAVGLCYPAMPTTALGAIPGGCLMYALSAQILREQGKYQDLSTLAKASMAMFQGKCPPTELRLDEAYQACLPEFHRRKDALGAESMPGCFDALYR